MAVVTWVGVGRQSSNPIFVIQSRIQNETYEREKHADNRDLLFQDLGKGERICER